jgi:hypothetical protein
MFHIGINSAVSGENIIKKSATLQGLVGDWRSVEGQTGEA